MKTKVFKGNISRDRSVPNIALMTQSRDYLIDYRGTAFSLKYDLAPYPPLPFLLSPISKLDGRHTGRLRKRNNWLGEYVVDTVLGGRSSYGPLYIV